VQKRFTNKVVSVRSGSLRHPAGSNLHPSERFVDAKWITEVIPIQTLDRHDRQVGCVLREDVCGEVSARKIGIRHFHSLMLIGRPYGRPYAGNSPL
jgi:hypothetical protein